MKRALGLRPVVSALLSVLCVTLPAHAPLAQGQSAASAASATTQSASAPRSGIELQWIDRSVRPQDDLFRFVNGKWLAATPIPADRDSMGTFIKLRDESDANVRKLIEELAAKPQAAGSESAKIAAYWTSFMDEAGIERAGIAPLRPLLAEVDAVKTPAELAGLFGRWQGLAESPLSLRVRADAENPTVYSAFAWQGGLGLGNRNFYVMDGERFANARAAYLKYLETVFGLIGDKTPAQSAAAVLALETEIARAHWEPARLRNPRAVYNPMTLDELRATAPQLPWAELLAGAGLQATAQNKISLGQKDYAATLGKLMSEQPLAAWQAYARARLVDATVQVLPKAFREASFTLRGRTLTGLEAERARWQLAIAEINGALGFAVGKQYVERHFPPAARARMMTMVNNLMRAYGDSIDGLTWMGPATKEEAKKKLAAISTKIGYPDVWRDYSALEVRAGDALGNRIRAARFDYARSTSRVGKTVDRSEWGMTPQTVNAYYNPSGNEIVFPAAILQPPFFDLNADDAVNYGAIGGVIGHEIGHGFDDQGSQYDAVGRLRNWWTAEDRKAFEALGLRLVEQYNAYEPVPGQRVNGRVALGENIADLSGLQIAYRAYQLSLGGKPAAVIDGFTGEQRFFIGWAQAWRSKTRPERMIQRMQAGPHSPEEFRANGVVKNHDGFQAAFGTKDGDKLFKPVDQRIRIW